MNKKWRIAIAVCYGVFFVAFLARGIFLASYERGLSEQRLPLEDAQLVQAERLGEGAYQITGGDGQLLFEGLNAEVRSVRLDGEFENYAGELDLYYKEPGQREYSLTQRVFARPLEGGGYEYLLPPGQYTGLRLDTGTEGGNTLQIDGITLNAPVSPLVRVLPSARGWMALLVLPALALCVIYTIIEWYRWWKNRWQNVPAGKK